MKFFSCWQLAFEDAVYIVDAVQGGNALMQACKPAMESPYVTKVCHDCKRDSEVPYSSTSCTPFPPFYAIWSTNESKNLRKSFSQISFYQDIWSRSVNNLTLRVFLVSSCTWCVHLLFSWWSSMRASYEEAFWTSWALLHSPNQSYYICGGYVNILNTDRDLFLSRAQGVCCSWKQTQVWGLLVMHITWTVCLVITYLFVYVTGPIFPVWDQAQ